LRRERPGLIVVGEPLGPESVELTAFAEREGIPIVMVRSATAP
jgi:hypothetical protein